MVSLSLKLLLKLFHNLTLKKVRMILKELFIRLLRSVKAWLLLRVLISWTDTISMTKQNKMNLRARLKRILKKLRSHCNPLKTSILILPKILRQFVTLTSLSKIRVFLLTGENLLFKILPLKQLLKSILLPLLKVQWDMLSMLRILYWIKTLLPNLTKSRINLMLSWIRKIWLRILKVNSSANTLLILSTIVFQNMFKPQLTWRTSSIALSMKSKIPSILTNTTQLKITLKESMLNLITMLAGLILDSMNLDFSPKLSLTSPTK